MDQVMAELKMITQQEFFNVDTTFADPMHHQRTTSIASSLSKLSLVDRAESVSEDRASQQGSPAGGMTADDFEQFFVSTREDQQQQDTTGRSGSGRVKSKSWTRLKWSNFKSLVPAQE
jgi:hypothetical protein